jgi:methyl-accepting chemotaxis protein
MHIKSLAAIPRSPLALLMLLHAAASVWTAWGGPVTSLGWLVGTCALLALWRRGSTWPRQGADAPVGLALAGTLPCWLVLGSGEAGYLVMAMGVLSVLPGLQQMRLQVAAGVWLAAAPVVLTMTGALPGDPTAMALWLPSLAVLAQALWLSVATARARLRDDERRDVDFLVKAMGRGEQIRLNLGAVRAETELGKKLKDVQERMALAVTAASQASHGVRNASGDISYNSRALGDGAELTATELREGAMSLEQISMIVGESADAATAARQVSDEALGRAQAGAELFSQVMTKMQAIHADSGKIAEIVTLIDGIAFQTNILALNAAVEAARAGEAGRGFSVVASEVRALAKRAATGASDIRALIQNSMGTIDEGTKLVKSADLTMGQILISVREVGQAFETLSADTREHAGSIASVTASMQKLNQQSAMNAVMARDLTRIAANLSEQGKELETVLGSFQLDAVPYETAPRTLAAVSATSTGSAETNATRAPTPGAAPAASAQAAANDNIEFF